MKLLNILSEIGEATSTTYPYKVDIGKLTRLNGTTSTLMIRGTFETEDGTVMRVSNNISFVRPSVFNDVDMVSVSVFYESMEGGLPDNYTFSLTGAGLKIMFQVMATVLKFTAECVRYINKEYNVNVDYLTFAPSTVGKKGEKYDRIGKYGDKRKRLYTTYLDKAMKSGSGLAGSGIMISSYDDYYGVVNVNLEPQI